MQIVIVTGMSGAGKTAAIKFLEDFGYYCVDNLPIPLMPKFLELVMQNKSFCGKAALGIDVRDEGNLPMMEGILNDLEEKNIICQILFLDASNECLMKRFKETRRSHPLAVNGHIEDGIAAERKVLKYLRNRADYVINTSNLLTRELKGKISEIFLQGEEFHNLYVTVTSFGFKYGIPADADIVLDVRFLPNPYYFAQMRPLTGNDPAVRDYVMSFEQTKLFLDKLTDLVRFLLPNYISEGKTQLVIAIGCTGGKHRSVTIANALYERIRNEKGIGVKAEHRDIEKDRK